MAVLVDKSMPTVVVLYDTIPPSLGDRTRGPRRTLLVKVACRLSYRVPLTKLVELDGNTCLYLIVLMVAMPT